MVKAKSTPVPLAEEQQCCNNDVFVAVHRFDSTEPCCGADSELIGIFTDEKEATKAAKAYKSHLGIKGKAAKSHDFVVEPWCVCDKFNKDDFGG
jgi:hypothetical protein